MGQTGCAETSVTNYWPTVYLRRAKILFTPQQKPEFKQITKLTNSKGQSSYSEANRYSTSQAIPRI